MRVKNVKPPARAREFHREGWPDLDKVEYSLGVVGTCRDNNDDIYGWAIVGPYYFGRAFEKPPFFTWSATAGENLGDQPQITVGVAEWIVDERGMFLGAYIWIQILGQEALGCG